MGFVYRRGRKLWIQYKGAQGERERHPTPFYVGDERRARALLRRVESKIAAGREVDDFAGPVTVKRFSDRWLDERKTLVSDWKTDDSRLRNHILPRLGLLKLEEVRPRHLISLVRHLRVDKQLAPKTVRSVYAVIRALFRDAVRAELIDASPCVLTSRDLGPCVDKDPEWRATAIFTRAELETLISDERLPGDRRVLYALLGIGGLRHGEAAGLRWRHYEPDLAPLGRLSIVTSYDKGRTKTGRARYLPVHPVLAAILAQWKLEGWPALFGRTPEPDDLVIPFPPGGKMKAGSMRKAHNSWLALQKDLDDLELRRRRVHDLRRTMISLSRMDGARASILKVCTHGAGKKAIMDAYTTFPWNTLCAEVGKLNVKRQSRGEVVRLPVAACGEGLGTVGGPFFGAVDKKGHDSAALSASPTGFEPVSPA